MGPDPLPLPLVLTEHVFSARNSPSSINNLFPELADHLQFGVPIATTQYVPPASADNYSSVELYFNKLDVTISKALDSGVIRGPLSQEEVQSLVIHREGSDDVRLVVDCSLFLNQYCPPLPFLFLPSTTSSNGCSRAAGSGKWTGRKASGRSLFAGKTNACLVLSGKANFTAGR